MILMRSNIPPNSNPVAIGAPQISETCIQIAQPPNRGREKARKSSEIEEKSLQRGEIVNSDAMVGGVRRPKSNWEIPV